LPADPETAGARFGERVGETALGIGIAYLGQGGSDCVDPTSIVLPQFVH
jgi:hypothetical protein